MSCVNICKGKKENAPVCNEGGRKSSTEPHGKKAKMTKALDYLKSMTTVVADTGDFECKYYFLIHKIIFPVKRQG